MRSAVVRPVEQPHAAKPQADNSADQLLLNAELAIRMLPDREVRLKFLVLTRTRTPIVAGLVSAISESWNVFILVAVVLTASSALSGEIRLKQQTRRR